MEREEKELLGFAAGAPSAVGGVSLVTGNFERIGGLFGFAVMVSVTLVIGLGLWTIFKKGG